MSGDATVLVESSKSLAWAEVFLSEVDMPVAVVEITKAPHRFAASLRKRLPGRRLGGVRSHPGVAAARWVETHAQIRGFAASHDLPYTHVTYEGRVARPQEQIATIRDTVGRGPRDAGPGTEHYLQGNPGVADQAVKTLVPELRLDESWRSVLARRNLAALYGSAALRDLAVGLGHTLPEPLPRTSRAGDGMLATGRWAVRTGRSGRERRRLSRAAGGPGTGTR